MCLLYKTSFYTNGLIDIEQYINYNEDSSQKVGTEHTLQLLA